ncbi:hypothetical protein ACP70R_033488 [Stipagrostis hirtigluma subsp. patula]
MALRVLLGAGVGLAEAAARKRRRRVEEWIGNCSCSKVERGL